MDYCYYCFLDTRIMRISNPILGVMFEKDNFLIFEFERLKYFN